MEPIVPSSEFRAEQFSPLCVIWELLFLKINVFLLITRERVFIKKHYGTKWSFSVQVEPIPPRSEFRAEQFSRLCVIWELLFLKINVFPLITRERVFIKKHYGTKWSFSVQVEPTVPSSEFRAEQFSSLCVIWELLFPKINVFLLITRERVFIKKHYGTKWSFSVQVEPIVPSSEFRAEQFSSLCMIWELLFLKINVFLLITRELVFYKKKKKKETLRNKMVL